jgi:hypothetical protein
MGRTSFALHAAESVDEAIRRLGEIKATGAQLKGLDCVYELLLKAQSQLEAGDIAANE